MFKKIRFGTSRGFFPHIVTPSTLRSSGHTRVSTTDSARLVPVVPTEGLYVSRTRLGADPRKDVVTSVSPSRKGHPPSSTGSEPLLSYESAPLQGPSECVDTGTTPPETSREIPFDFRLGLTVPVVGPYRMSRSSRKRMDTRATPRALVLRGALLTTGDFYGVAQRS